MNISIKFDVLSYTCTCTCSYFDVWCSLASNAFKLLESGQTSISSV